MPRLQDPLAIAEALAPARDYLLKEAPDLFSNLRTTVLVAQTLCEFRLNYRQENPQPGRICPLDLKLSSEPHPEFWLKPSNPGGIAGVLLYDTSICCTVD